MQFNRRAHPAGATFGTWIAPDNWVHRRVDWPQAKGVKPRGSLLFAGGRGDFIEKYLEAFAHWHGEGWNVTAFDWRGQGASRGGTDGGDFHALDRLVEDLGALIAEWNLAAPGPHVAIAHSMGGHILLRTLAELKPKLEAAVLVAPMLAINSGPMPAWSASWLATAMSAFGWSRHPAWHQARTPMPAGSLRQTILTSCPERYEDEAYWWGREPGFNIGPPSWGWLDAAYRSSARFTPEALGGIAVPVLLLGTGRDRLVSPAAIRRAASLIPGAELKMYQDAGHEILRERY
jgi:lysophospholipase